MNKVLLFILTLIAFVQCKKDSLLALADIHPIVGEWRLTSYKGTDGSTTVPDTTGQGRSLLMVIRADGVIVDGYGRLPCCPPSTYFFKEREFIPRPAAPIEPSLCPFVKCGPCPEMRINMTAPDVLLVRNCGGGTSTYVREK
jgi:hypothetical protein